MATIQYLTKIINICLIITAVAFCSCNDNDIVEEATKTVKIRSCNINCSITDDATTRATGQHQWKNGDKLLIAFDYSYSRDALGVATFNNGIWKMELLKDSKAIPITTNGRCNITYIDGDYALSSDSVNITKDCPIYSKQSGNYTFTSEGDLSIEAKLVPYVDRFRIKGSQNETFEIKGINFPYCFRFEYLSSEKDFFNKKNLDSKTVVCSIKENGAYYTPYIYGETLSLPIKIKKGPKVFALRGSVRTYENQSFVFDSTSGFSDKNWVSEDYVVKKFSIYRNEISGYHDLFNLSYDLIDLGIELSTKTGGVSAKGQINCTATSTSKGLVLFCFANAGAKNQDDEHYDSLFDNRGGLLDIEDAWANPSPTFIGSCRGDKYDNSKETYVMYFYGRDAIIESGSYVELSNF